MLAPICLFTYNRCSETEQTVKALINNNLAKESDLFVFSDAAKDTGSPEKVRAVRDYLKSIEGFKSVTIFEAVTNKGLANSIIDGVSQIINQFGKVIVLEDDLITCPNFLNFMNQALGFYKDSAKIFSVSGYTMDLPSLRECKKDFYLGYRASSWGWATWRNKWEEVDWTAKNYEKVIYNPLGYYRFTRGGSDMPYMLWKQMHGKIDSWAIRWCYHQFKKELLTVFSSSSKLESIGFGIDATHTKVTKRFDTVVDVSGKTEFKFEEELEIDTLLLKEFRTQFSLWNRLKDKI